MKVNKPLRKKWFPKKSAKKTVSKATIKKEVAQQLSRQVETKHYEYSLINKLIYSNGGPVDNNVIPLSPYSTYLAISQGTGDGQRIGNRIKLKNLSINFTIVPQPYSMSGNPVPQPTNVMFVIFYDKLNTTTLPTPYTNGDFFQNNNSTAGFSDTLNDITRWFNQDRYKIFYKRVYKVGFAADTGTGNLPQYQFYLNNDYKYNIIRNVNVTKHAVQNVTYSDNNSIPTSRGLFCAWYAVPASGGSWALPGVTPIAVSFQTHMSYTDE